MRRGRRSGDCNGTRNSRLLVIVIAIAIMAMTIVIVVIVVTVVLLVCLLFEKLLGVVDCEKEWASAPCLLLLVLY